MNIKTLLPFEQYTFVTKLSIPEISNRIMNSTAPRTRLFSFPEPPAAGKLFRGSISGNQFELLRIIQYRNSFLPVIKGEMNTYLGKTEVSVRQAPVLAVLIFMGLWMGIVTLACIGMLSYGVTHLHLLKPGPTIIPFLVPFFMWIGGAAMVSIGFRLESGKAKKLLLELLEGEVAG
ncbi:hypothetical protein [Chitinophaga eiseniae]|uniref:Uncharacterized protein n=1 Tax=Chitinophaga eiseniae TaxID=634771 RepID=A0A847SPZ2_9BACT|nr:hypothetical protein [Chitinophaga eiseniae]NLR82364.1 hypothetical protein [Chitinophaga eiseniae]